MSTLSPTEAVDALEAAHERALVALRRAIKRFAEQGIAPSADERALFRYPKLRVHYDGSPPAQRPARAYAQLIWPGDYEVSITQPAFFRAYLLEQLSLLVADYGATISIGTSEAEIAYSFAVEASMDLDVSSAELVRHFPAPRLAV